MEMIGIMRYSDLYNRVVFLESLIYEEIKKDLQDRLGSDLYNAYMNNVKKKIPSAQDIENSYPDYTPEDLEDPDIRKKFIKKYSKLANHLLITKSGKFYDVPQFVTIVTAEDGLDDYNDMKEYLLNICDTYRDLSNLMKVPVDEIEDFVGNYVSVRQRKETIKKEESETVYEDGDWLVLHILTPEAAQQYGSGTTWCISGLFPDQKNKGRYFFNKYVKDDHLADRDLNVPDSDLYDPQDLTFKNGGGYYFFINKPTRNKYCVLQNRNKEIKSIWDSSDELKGSSYAYWLANDPDAMELPPIKEVPEIGNLNYSTALFDAIDDGRSDLIEDFLENGADPNSVNDEGKTVIIQAILQMDYDSLEMLLEYGADPNKPDTRGNSPLSVAVKESDSDAVKILLDYGADPNATDENGKSAIRLARENDLDDAVDMLIDSGAVEESYRRRRFRRLY